MKRVAKAIGWLALLALIGMIAVSETTQQHLLFDSYTVQIEQGPIWLVELLYNPAGWEIPAIAGLAVFIAGTAYVGYLRNGLTNDVQREILENLLILSFAGAITLAMVNFLSMPYAVDVLVGGIGGFVVARALSLKYVYPS